VGYSVLFGIVPARTIHRKTKPNLGPHVGYSVLLGIVPTRTIHLKTNLNLGMHVGESVLSLLIFSKGQFIKNPISTSGGMWVEAYSLRTFLAKQYTCKSK
jgi:hypothetical protein